MQFSKFLLQGESFSPYPVLRGVLTAVIEPVALFCVLAQLLLVNAVVLEQRADQFVCDANGSRGGCDTTAAGKVR